MMVSRLEQSQKDDLLQFLLYCEYQREFEVIDGMNQHPKGYNFDAWIEHLLEGMGL